MKGTDNFKKVIQEHLELLAKEDPLFAETLKKANKNIDDCITYILNSVQESGANGFADGEIFNMAVHYYDEDDIKPGKSVNCNVVVNHTVELSEEEIKAAKEKAIQNVIDEHRDKIKKKNTPKPKTEAVKIVEPSLFD